MSPMSIPSIGNSHHHLADVVSCRPGRGRFSMGLCQYTLGNQLPFVFSHNPVNP